MHVMGGATARGAAKTLLLALALVAGCDDDSAPALLEFGMPADFAARDLALPTDNSDGAAARPLPPLPLRTSGRFIVDAAGKRFKLAAVNWYGAEEIDHVVAGLDRQPLELLARAIADAGFNAMRLPWSNELIELDPVVGDATVAANPSLRGKHAMEVFDAVAAALGRQGLVVILDNHTSAAGWCCTLTDGNTLWYNNAYPEASWLADWRAIVTRYLGEPAVVAADLRNEPRGMAAWGGSDPAVDWRAAAMRGGNAVLGVNPRLLVMVEGINYSLDFTGIHDAATGITLAVANRLVWSPHDYGFDHNDIVSYDTTEPALKTELGNKWGFLLVQGQPYSAPLWVGEFGTCNTADSCVDYADNTKNGFWFAGVRRYLHDADIDWAYWPWNGTEANGAPTAPGRHVGDAETYGVLNASWTGPALPSLLTSLQALQPATQGP
ncbi:MAG: glycoside hydrolase family 5 protein [Myxococcales bacterium]|nr:glycoside hydrolase family 5 protein [Myxococcales bacterium]